MEAEKLKRQAVAAIDELTPKLVAISQEIHANPELCFKEFKASKLLSDALREAGLGVCSPAFGLDTAFVGEFGDSGPIVGIIAEYDALPEIGHACGHNIIGTSAVGAALALHALGAGFPGRVRVLGTPAEEGGGGKVLMARQGAFDGLDCAMMVHPAPADMATFPLIARAGVKVGYRGKPSHASSEPEAGINALDGLIAAYNAIGAWRQHMPARHRIHGIITHGGVASNIVPDYAEGHFTVRAPTRTELAKLRQRVDECFKAGELASGAKLELEWEDLEYFDLMTNWPLAKAYQANAEALGRTFVSTDTLPVNQASSTDMGNVSHIVPSIHPMIAAVPDGTAFHTREFTQWSASDLGMKAMVDAAKSMAMTTIDYIATPALRANVQEAFQKSAD